MDDRLVCPDCGDDDPETVNAFFASGYLSVMCHGCGFHQLYIPEPEKAELGQCVNCRMFKGPLWVKDQELWCQECRTSVPADALKARQKARR